ncbi:MAG: zinc ribbon domain-containing protein [Magnetococcales bacterium]|nr:zinc ribbon domain-containing protein [Magnetococcales bacterium]
MPTYDYKCNSCNHPFEHAHGMNEKVELHCPACGGANVRKVFSTGGLVGANSGKGSPPPPSPCGGGGCGGGMCGLN